MTKRTLYEVTVWNNTNGDVEKYVSEATAEELAWIEESFEDEPWYQVVVDREWEEDADEED